LTPNLLPDLPAVDLRIVPTEALLSHERHDAQRTAPLVKYLRRDGVLKNPPIVTPSGLDDNTYVMLDGANRIFALNELGIRHTLVQVVPYTEPHVQLLTWYHVICDITPAEMEACLRSVPGIEIGETNLSHARGLLAARAILSYCVVADGRVLTLAGGGLDLHERNRLLNAVCDSYLGVGTLYRQKTDVLSELLDIYPSMAGPMIYPRYEPAEILDLAQHGMEVPPGLTRHIVRGRALRLNYPLERLKADTSLEQKNAELKEWVQQKFSERQVRYYAESTYLFDE